MNDAEMDVDLERELAAYGLRAEPFQPGTNLKFLWRGGPYRDILSGLKANILGNQGLLLLTGDVGTGKTTLINALIEDLRDTVIVVRVVSGSLERVDLFDALATACGLGGPPVDRELFHRRLEQCLQDAGSRRRRVVLVIDEAQSMSREEFAEIRELASIGDDGPARLNILLVGQNGLNGILAEPEHAALVEQVKFRATTAALSEPQVRRYVQHRLRMAGTGRRVFTAGALREIAAFSQGIPRLVNVIGDLALTNGYRRRPGTVNAEVVKECAGKLGRPRRKARTSRTRRPGGAEVGPGTGAPAELARNGDSRRSESGSSSGEPPDAVMTGPEAPVSRSEPNEPGGMPAPAALGRNWNESAPEWESARGSERDNGEGPLPAVVPADEEHQLAGPASRTDAARNGHGVVGSESPQRGAESVGRRLALPPAPERVTARPGRAGPLARYALLTVLALASIGYLHYSDRSTGQERAAAPPKATTEPPGTGARSDPSVGESAGQPAQSSEIDIDLLKARQGFIDLLSASVAVPPRNTAGGDVAADESPAASARMPGPTSGPGVASKRTREPGGRSDGAAGRFQEVPPASRPSSAESARADAAESANSDDIIDWLLKEYPARRQ